MATESNLRIGQRATKAEREAVREAIKTIWATASESHEMVEFQFPDTPAGKRECRGLHDSLTVYRRRLEKRKLEDFHHWNQVNSLMLCKSADDTKVFFKKKIGEVSGRSLVILNAAARLQAATNTVIECPAVRIDTLDNE
jgi:hypothetical protein